MGIFAEVLATAWIQTLLAIYDCPLQSAIIGSETNGRCELLLESRELLQ